MDPSEDEDSVNIVYDENDQPDLDNSDDGSEMTKIYKPGFVKLSFFQEIIFLSNLTNIHKSCSQRQRIELYTMNLNIIFGTLEVDLYKSVPSIQKSQKWKKFINFDFNKFHQQFQKSKIRPKLGVVICTPLFLPYFQEKISLLPKIYHKCIIFDPDFANIACEKSQYVQASVHQIFSLEKIIVTLQKQLKEQQQKCIEQMFKVFNINILNQV